MNTGGTMREHPEGTSEVHPIPWMGEGTVPNVTRQVRQHGGLLRFAAGTAAIALAVGVGGGLVARSFVQREPQAAVTTSTTGQPTGQPERAPAPAPAPAAH